MDQEIKQEFESLTKIIKDSFEDLESRMATKEELKYLENQMVTKDYLDEKLADLRGDLNVMMRKGDTKFLRLVEFLKEGSVLTDSQVQELLSMEPFPKLAL